MSMKPYRWRTQNASYVYVDSATGSDAFGDGTQANPYRSLGKAWRGHKTRYPATIVCRGFFSEDMADGNHTTTIQGDYYGAATFDGQDKYIMYGFSMPNMIVRNVPHPTINTVVLYNWALAGVGRAVNGGSVGNADTVNGASASSVLMVDCVHYFGGLGGSSAVARNAIIRPRWREGRKLFFAGYGGDTSTANTFYDMPKESRVHSSSSATAVHYRCIYAKCAILANEGIKFRNCIFLGDCSFWNGDVEFTPVGETPEERMQSVADWVASQTISAGRRTIFEDCVVHTLSSDEVFNDPSRDDFTLKLSAIDGYIADGGSYNGALPPALHVPVLSDSSRNPGSWDETTASGIISVADDRIIIGGASLAITGEIKSKVITINPHSQAISAIYALYGSQAAEGIQLGHTCDICSEVYALGDVLPIGRYRLVGGDAIYNNVYVPDGDIIPITVEGTSVSAPTEQDEAVSAAIRLEAYSNANIIDHMWLRSAPTAYALLTSADGLQAGATYCNIYDREIIYRGRTIVSGESFEAENSTDTFTCADDPGYKIAAIFDDSRVPEQPWVPAQMWGEYFAGRQGATYQTDAEGNIIGSGTYLAWIANNQGGYLTSAQRTRAQARYIQLMITAKRPQLYVEDNQ